MGPGLGRGLDLHAVRQPSLAQRLAEVEADHATHVDFGESNDAGQPALDKGSFHISKLVHWQGVTS
jgi:hypothetical protein